MTAATGGMIAAMSIIARAAGTEKKRTTLPARTNNARQQAIIAR